MLKQTRPWGVGKLAALAGAERRLAAAGCSLSPRTGFALWPASPEAARRTLLTVEIIEDARLVEEAFRELAPA